VSISRPGIRAVRKTSLPPEPSLEGEGNIAGGRYPSTGKKENCQDGKGGHLIGYLGRGGTKKD